MSHYEPVTVIPEVHFITRGITLGPWGRMENTGRRLRNLCQSTKPGYVFFQREKIFCTDGAMVLMKEKNHDIRARPHWEGHWAV
jgi:hypothetical protein